ncbi:VOC family protein [Clostridioides sp. ZZV14-5902]|uniref:VOC family protein n=1 Tax=Clostridioides sp. ZZV14-5902 TaxID=2811486 RepID=UPI001D12DF22|nr:VOC family protein [Clostridioides sp. ZZV14-5902]
MLTPYLIFNGTCEKAFNFYAEAFGGGKTLFARLDNNPSNPVMHASVTFTKYEGCIMGADTDEPVVISGMAICVVLPSREVIEEISVKLAEGGTLVQGFLPHPPPDQNDGGAEVLDRYGYTWYLST